MAATLRIKVDNSQAKAANADLRRDLHATADAAGELGETAAAAGEALPVEESLRFRAELEALAQEIGAVVEENRAANIEAQAWSDTLADVRGKIFEAIQVGAQWAGQLAVIAGKTVVANAAANELASGWTAAGVAVRTALGYLTGAGTIIAGVGLGWKVYNEILEHTGKVTVKQTEDFSQATEEQIAAFNKLAAESSRTGKSIEDVMARAGKSWDDFGVRVITVETNLDRVRKAHEQFADTVAQPWAEAAAGVKSTAYELSHLEEITKEFDKRFTEGTNNYVVNIGAIGDALQEVFDELSAAAQGGMNWPEIQKSNDLLREQGKITAELVEFNKTRADDFDRLAAAQANAGQQAADRAEIERRGSLQSIAAVDAEIRKLRDKGAELALLGQFTEEHEKQLVADLDQFERQKEQIRKRAKEAAEKLTEEQAAHTKAENDRAQADYDAQNQKAYDESIRLARAAFDEEMKLLAQRNQMFVASINHEIAQHAAAEEKKLAISRKAADERRRLIVEQFGGQEALANQVTAATDPRAVRNEFADQAAARARQKFRNENIDDVDVTDSAAMRRFAAEQARAAAAARADAFRRFNRGDVDPQQLAQAQQAASGQVLAAMQANGQLSADVVGVAAQTLQATAQHTQTIAALQEQVQQLKGMAVGVNRGAQNAAQRQRAQAGGLSQ